MTEDDDEELREKLHNQVLAERRQNFQDFTMTTPRQVVCPSPSPKTTMSGRVTFKIHL